ncbi:MAG: EAL domain-containing protein [Pseudomonadota bacterium]|nr:EAL domain-containing protein [Pseudomonadota bacterium]
MQLRTRITVTFLLLLAAVLTAALGTVSAANHRNAAREVQHQLDTGTRVFRRVLEANRRQLTQAADAVAADYGFREAVATRDVDTLVSALENAGGRIGASMVVLTTLDGKVLASFGSRTLAGMPFAAASSVPVEGAADGATAAIVESGHIYQLVGVVVRSPLPVARVYMGFELDAAAARELADITGLAVTLSISSGTSSKDVVRTAIPAATAPGDLATRQIELAKGHGTHVVATLSRSLAEARAPFDPLENVLLLIAAVGLAASACATLWLARDITRPLQNLTAAVGKIRAGFYDTPISMQRRDELGLLAEGMQLMQAAVHSRDRSISRLAYEDTLTGLQNWVGFSAALTEILSRGGTPVGVAVINLRRFRRINDLLGYAVGDSVLKEIAARLTAHPPVAIAVGRLAADEFVAYAAIADRAALPAWGAALAARFIEPITVEDQPIDVNATIGLALAHATDARAADLLRCADLAMERARRDKRPLAIYEPSLQPKARGQLSLLGELRRAIDQHQLCLHLQPKMELSTGRVAGAEALLRWQHPKRGLIAPAAFIPFAEQTGFIRQLTRWVLERAVARGASWYRAGKALPLAVNISADDLADPQFDHRVSNALARHGLPPALLTLEVTESSLIEDPDQACKMLEALALLGVTLSLDDFGTGYSSLSHLARMPVHEIKIDRSFVQGLASDVGYASVVRSAIDMGHSLGLKVVAEGIESDAVAQRLLAMQCDIGQGFFYARPMPSADLEIWLASRTLVPVIAVPANLTVGEIDSTLTLIAL